MDLTEISRSQAQRDLDLANARLIDISARIARLAGEVRRLRDEVSALEAARKTVPVAAPTVVGQLATHRSLGKRLLASLGKIANGSNREIVFHIDQVCGANLSNAPVQSTLFVSRINHRVLTISGWAVAKNFAGPFIQVEAQLCGASRSVSGTSPTMLREDVARHFGSAVSGQSGFTVQIPMSDVHPGTYRLAIRGITATGDDAARESLTIEVQ